MDSRAIVAVLEADGWRKARVTGSHHHFKHPTKAGVVTVPHPRRELPIGTLRSIERATGVKLR